MPSTVAAEIRSAWSCSPLEYATIARRAPASGRATARNNAKFVRRKSSTGCIRAGSQMRAGRSRARRTLRGGGRGHAANEPAGGAQLEDVVQRRGREGGAAAVVERVRGGGLEVAGEFGDGGREHDGGPEEWSVDGSTFPRTALAANA